MPKDALSKRTELLTGGKRIAAKERNIKALI